MDERHTSTPIVAIIGRPNVGKSTLFNRLLERKQALMSPTPGTTQDINFGHCHWQGDVITVIDTAGLDLTSDDATDEAFKKQAVSAMHKADIIYFLIDATTGVMPQDKALAKHLQKSDARIMLIANKADSPSKRYAAISEDWGTLGFGMPTLISAANGSGVGDLLEETIRILKEKGLTSKPLPEIDVRVTIIGKPNSGKSTLLNALAGEERVIVSEIPHTTKEPQDTLITYEHEELGTQNILLIDTVGIRKRAKVERGMEKVGVSMSIERMTEGDVTFLLVDAVEGIGAQERKLAGLIENKDVGVVIVVNKWDQSKEADLGGAEEYAKEVARQLPFYSWAPVTFISAKTGRHVTRLLDFALRIANERKREIPQETLDAFVEKLKKKHHAMFTKGANRPKVYGITQIRTGPPHFMVIVKDKDTLHQNFLRFIMNRMREEFGFEGVPVKISGRELRK